MIFDTLKKAYQLIKQEEIEKQKKFQMELIAKNFNDLYTYVKKYNGDYAWMCPNCHFIHKPIGHDVFCGLQYPACCKHREGHRLDENINTNAEMMQKEVDRLKNRVKDSDNCRDQAKRELEKQDKELAALRGFANDVINYFSNRGYVNQRAMELGLLDRNGNQTAALKGE